MVAEVDAVVVVVLAVDLVAATLAAVVEEVVVGAEGVAASIPEEAEGPLGKQRACTLEQLF